MARMQAKPAKPLKPVPNEGAETRDTDGPDLSKMTGGAPPPTTKPVRH